MTRLKGRVRFVRAAAAVGLAAIAAGCGRSPDVPEGGDAVVIGRAGRLAGEFRRPRALAVDSRNATLYVVDRTGRVQRLDRDGAPLHQWTLAEYERGQPVGIEVDRDGSVLVSDTHYSRILRFSEDGKLLLGTYGREGTGPGELICGRDVVVDSLGFIYVGDYDGKHDRIQKLTADGRFVLEWGGYGDEPGRFRRPQGMAVEPRDGKELILVADACNHRLQRFSAEGEWLASIGSAGDGAGELLYPYAVAVGRDGSLFVCEWGNSRIQRFDPDGRSLGTWGRPGRRPGELWHPWDVEVGVDGTLYVADCDNDRVQAVRWPGSPLAEGGPAAFGRARRAASGS